MRQTDQMWRAMWWGIRLSVVVAMTLVLNHLPGTVDAQASQATAAGAPTAGREVPSPLSSGSFEFDTSEQGRVRAVIVARGLSHPWALAFLPDGSILVTERGGQLRIIRRGVLDPKPVATLAVAAVRLSGLMDVVLHPRFGDNKWVYLTYNKTGSNDDRLVTLARGTWTGSEVVDIRDLFVSDAPIGASRIVFGKDGLLYLSVGSPPGPDNAMKSQDPMQHTGKMLRLRDDGSPADGNPFVGRAGYKPEIYSLGHRNQLGLTLHPVTGEIWQSENGPLGGDEVNVIRAGRNYGWPLVSFGRWYTGPRVSENPYREDLELPVLYWVPSIAISGMTFYTGERFPRWKGNLFVGGLQEGRVPGTGKLQRIVFNPDGEEARRESFLMELRQRIREVKEGPDGYLYVLTDEDSSVLLRLEPAVPSP